MQPFLLKPAYKDYLWGGTRLKTGYGKADGPTPCAESWELSVHPDGQSVVASGPYAGQAFAALAAEHPEILGSRCNGALPILVKLIDAKQPLSLQVHPDDAYAQAHEGDNGKAEAWIVLESKPGASIYFGFEVPCTREEMAQRIEENTLTEVLHEERVKPGDVFFIPAGTVHAIGAGIVIAEVQQNSNATYRVYDYGRRDADGNTRPLHVQKALEVSNLAPAKRKVPGSKVLEFSAMYCLEQLVNCDLFCCRRLFFDNGDFEEPGNSESFTALLCTKGSVTLTTDGGELLVEKGSTAFVPASTAYTLDGPGDVLLITV